MAPSLDVLGSPSSIDDVVWGSSYFDDVLVGFVDTMVINTGVVYFEFFRNNSFCQKSYSDIQSLVSYW